MMFPLELRLLILCILASVAMTFNINNIDLISLANRIGRTLEYIETSPFVTRILNVDITGGADIISSRGRNQFISPSTINYSLVLDNEMTSLTTNYNISYLKTKNITAYTGLMKVHQISRSVVRKVPDLMLYGILGLIATELVQRELTKQSQQLPPIMRNIANKTILELDNKLELLSALQWNFEPFLALEYDSLQTQPGEIIDKYLVSEILGRLDKDLSPFLMKLIADPKSVREIVNKVKEVVKLLTVVINSNNNNNNQQVSANRSFRQNLYHNPLQTTTNLILENMEYVGSSLESAIIEWNKNIEDIGRLMKAESLIAYLTKLNATTTTESLPTNQSYEIIYTVDSNNTAITLNDPVNTQPTKRRSFFNFFFRRFIKYKHDNDKDIDDYDDNRNQSSINVIELS